MPTTWIHVEIQPDHDSIIHIQFDIYFQIAQNDTLFIIRDMPTLAIYIFTQDSGKLSLNVFSPYIQVRLKTDTVETKNGFTASYSSDIPSYCNILQCFPLNRVQWKTVGSKHIIFHRLQNTFENRWHEIHLPAFYKI
jgi:hypothetical protein